MDQRQFRMLRDNDIVVLKPAFRSRVEDALLDAGDGDMYGISQPVVHWNGRMFLDTTIKGFLKSRAFYVKVNAFTVDIRPVLPDTTSDMIMQVMASDVLAIGGYRAPSHSAIKVGDYVMHAHSDSLYFSLGSPLSGIARVVDILDRHIFTSRGHYNSSRLHKLSTLDLQRIGSDLEYALNFNLCISCGVLTESTHETADGGDTLALCPDCICKIKTCDDCGIELIPNHDDHYSLADNRDAVLCDNCYEEYPACDCCGNRCTEVDVNNYCESCKYRNVIRNYTYRPSDPAFFKAKKTNPDYYFGLELEVLCHNPSKSAYQILESAPDDLIYFKDDSSIAGQGFEMVTNPFSWSYYLKAKGDFMGILQEMRGVGATAHKSCGIHIHVSRSAFKSQKHLYSFLRLVTAENNRAFTETMAGRSTDEWASLSNQGDKNTIIDKAKCKDKSSGFGRYTAVNMDNSATIEIRIFRSTLDDLEFFKNIEYVKAMVDYTRDMPIKEAINALDFTVYILKSKEYPALRKWMLDESNLIPREPRAMINALDVEVSKHNKNIKFRPLRYKARQLMTDMTEKAQCQPLYRSVDLHNSGDGIPVVIERIKNALQSNFHNRI